jgi:hypothetical protein
MAAIRQRNTREVESSSDDDANILTRAQRLLPPSQMVHIAPPGRRTTQTNASQPPNVPQGNATSSDSDADLLRRAQQQKAARPPMQVTAPCLMCSCCESL